MATGTVTAYAYPGNICASFSPTTFEVSFTAVVGDGVQQLAQFGSSYTYDTTQTAAANIAAFKAQVALDSTNFGFTVELANIFIFTAVS